MGLPLFPGQWGGGGEALSCDRDKRVLFYLRVDPIINRVFYFRRSNLPIGFIDYQNKGKKNGRFRIDNPGPASH